MELLQAIALLCQVSSNNSYDYIQEKQLLCQKYYIECVNDRYLTEFFALKECIKKRK